VHIDGQVVVDCATHHRLNPGLGNDVEPFNGEKTDSVDGDDEEWSTERSELLPDSKPKLKPLSDEQCLLASSMV
jgi:hypothetical protein